VLVDRFFGQKGTQTLSSLVFCGPPGPGPARSPRGRREHGSRPLRLESRRSFAAEEKSRRRLPWRAFPWREKQPRPSVGIPRARPRGEDSRSGYYLEAGRMKRPYPSRFQDKAQIMVVKGGASSGQLDHPFVT
jgi:hypothetical protein